MFSYGRYEFAPITFLALSLITFSNIDLDNKYTLLFLLPLCLFGYLFRVAKEQLIVSLALSTSLYLVQNYLFIEENKGTYFSVLNRVFDVNEWIKDYLSKNYSSDVGEVIGLLVFNHRKSKTYYRFTRFGISYLFSVSGLHFIFLRRVLGFFIKWKRVVISILVLYWIAINFSIPGLRVLLTLVFWKERDEIRKWSYVSIVSCLFNLHIYRTLSFQLSYFFSLLFIVNKQIVSNKFRLWIFNYISAFIFSTIAFLPFSPHKIYLLSIVNGIIFTPIIIPLFIYFFFTWFIVYLNIFHEVLANFFVSLYKVFELNTYSVSLKYWTTDLTQISLVSLSLVFLFFFYSSKCSSSTIQKTKGY